MTDSAVRIGVSACFFHADPMRAVFKGKTLLYMEHSMAELVMSQGALAMMIPPPGRYAGHPTVSLEAMVADLDGLVLQGGSDVAPESYGESPLRPQWGGDRVRDVYETALIEAFMAAGKPVLGICRGIQILNVALGGTLYQDINTQLPGTLVHRDWDIYDTNHHDVVMSGRLAQLYGTDTGRINTVHHQAIKDVAPGLEVLARCPDDDIIEALWRPRATEDDPYVMGIQWHPEFITPEDTGLLDPQVLITDFMGAVRARKARG